MDKLEADSWRWRTDVELVGEERAKELHPPLRVADEIGIMLPLAGDNVDALMTALGVWRESREKRFQTDEDRAMHVAGIYMSVALNGIGNLFGFIPPSAPAFNEEVAAEGRARGWRRS
jgi:hypothetical protein